jgi:hypothetical protein
MQFSLCDSRSEPAVLCKPFEPRSSECTGAEILFECFRSAARSDRYELEDADEPSNRVVGES